MLTNDAVRVLMQQVEKEPFIQKDNECYFRFDAIHIEICKEGTIIYMSLGGAVVSTKLLPPVNIGDTIDIRDIEGIGKVLFLIEGGLK